MEKPLGQPAEGAEDLSPASGWRAWRSYPGLRWVLAVVVAAAVATVFGVAALWPTEEGIEAATASADEIGLVTDRYGATVKEIRDGPCSYSTPESPYDCRQVTVVLDEGPARGSPVALPELDLAFSATTPSLRLGQKVIIGYEPSTDFYFYADADRRTPLAWLTALFAVFVIALGRRRGVLALVGMAGTLAVLLAFMAPSILDGNDPLLVSVVAASGIAFVSLYLVHGFNPITTVALVGTLSSLGLTLGLSWAFFELAAFTGLATEEGLVLPLIAGGLDVASLILGGAVIGALGALDDITVTQAALVAELRYRNPSLRVYELVASGIRVGREHIASTVNTLLLAYAGAAIPLLMLFVVSDQSLVMVANSEMVAVVIVRTLCGSIGLVAAVPITTTLAALVSSGRRPAETDAGSGSNRPEPPGG
ncbi:MAG: YibE/F family protein [Acidimicrobiia bacterium]|nr:YibE/F family protein [Acidimicrobiia bacterium]MYF83008.1 YibE/F family protein [Acidimicrobiia bacterium]